MVREGYKPLHLQGSERFFASIQSWLAEQAHDRRSIRVKRYTAFPLSNPLDP
jgi:hypothetical protein